MGAFVARLPIRTPRTLVRRLCVDDLEAFQAYRTDPDVGRYQGWSALSEAAARHFLEEMNAIEGLRLGDWVQLGIGEAGTGALIGDIGLYVTPDGEEAEIGFALGQPYQGRGLATEAIEATFGLLFAANPRIERVRAVTDARNDACIRLLERLRLHRVAEQQATFRGEPCIEYVYRGDRGTLHG